MDRVGVVVAVVVVLAGCSAVPVQQSPTPAPAASPPTTADAAGALGGPAGDGTATTDATPTGTPPENPWRADPVVVAVESPPNDSRNYVPLVEEALAYWETEGAAYGYEADYELRPDAENPDIRVSFVHRIRECDGVDSHTVGCAPVLDAGDDVRGTTPVRIEAGFTNETTVTVLKHELGHSRGLGHDAGEEIAFMNATIDAVMLPKPDATDRPSPWRDGNLSVYVDYGPSVDSDERATYDAEIAHALDYYEAGADGYVPENVSFTRVENRSHADVVISFPEQIDTDDGRGVSWSYRYVDPDADGAPEWYVGGDVRVVADDGSLVDWYVGYGLGMLFAPDSRESLPAPFDDDDLSDDEEWTSRADAE
jgi:hypothetical protein